MREHPHAAPDLRADALPSGEARDSLSKMSAIARIARLKTKEQVLRAFSLIFSGVRHSDRGKMSLLCGDFPRGAPRGRFRFETARQRAFHGSTEAETEPLAKR